MEARQRLLERRGPVETYGDWRYRVEEDEECVGAHGIGDDEKEEVCAVEAGCRGCQ